MSSSRTRSALASRRRFRASIACAKALRTLGLLNNCEACASAVRSEYPARRAAFAPFRWITYSLTNLSCMSVRPVSDICFVWERRASVAFLRSASVSLLRFAFFLGEGFLLALAFLLGLALAFVLAFFLALAMSTQFILTYRNDVRILAPITKFGSLALVPAFDSGEVADYAGDVVDSFRTDAAFEDRKDVVSAVFLNLFRQPWNLRCQAGLEVMEGDSLGWCMNSDDSQVWMGCDHVAESNGFTACGQFLCWHFSCLLRLPVSYLL